MLCAIIILIKLFKAIVLVISNVKMEHLFSARHGEEREDAEDERLSRHGRGQIERLADVIREIMCDKSACLVTSTAPRAIDSTELLSARLGITEYDREPYLWCAGDSPSGIPNYRTRRNESRLIEIVEARNERAQGIIVVSHNGSAEDLATAYQRMHGISGHVPELCYGEAAHLDFVNMTFQVVPGGR